MYSLSPTGDRKGKEPAEQVYNILGLSYGYTSKKRQVTAGLSLSSVLHYVRKKNKEKQNKTIYKVRQSYYDYKKCI